MTPEEPTTPDLVERVQSSFEAINRGDFDPIVWTLRDGLIWRGKVFLDQREALQAAGLEA